MMIEKTLKKIRTYFETSGISRRSFARRAGLWEASLKGIYTPNWNPTVSTLRKLESVIPPDFVPPEEAVSPEPERSPRMAKKPCGKGGRKK